MEYNTREEAENEARRMESKNPGQRFAAVEFEKGRFEVLEVRICEHCGKDWMTRAYGEYGLWCRECREKMSAENAARSKTEGEQARRENQQWAARDRWEE